MNSNGKKIFTKIANRINLQNYDHVINLNLYYE